MSRSYTSSKRDHQAVKPDFELDGITFVCEGGVTTLDISEFAQIAKTGIDTEDPAAAAVFAEFFQNALGPTVYAQFKKHIREHGTDQDVFLDIMSGIIEDFLGRPTEQPSSSHDGLSTTGTGSNPESRHISLQAGTVELRPAPMPGAEAAVRAAGSSPSPAGSSSMPYTRFG